MDKIYELYEMQDWEDLPSKKTPILSKRLLHIEQGIRDTSILANENSKKITSTKTYESLTDKPSINGFELTGDSSLENLGITEYVDSKIKELESAILEDES